MRFFFRILLVIGLTLLSFVTADYAEAADFDAVYEIDYELDPAAGVTKVKQNITLTNLQSNLRANSYSLTLDNSYKNLKAYDSSGPLTTNEQAGDDTSTISFTFNDKVVGVGNKLQWTIEYESTSLAQKHGRIWDITIPRVKEPDSYNITSYTARLHVPESVGPAHYLSPSAASNTTQNGIRTYTFDRDRVFPTGIVAAFGDYQLFDFTLKYHLHNPNIGQASTEIALPPDIPGQQQIIYKNLQPEPESLRTDADGNTLALYYLAANESLDITFEGSAKITSRYPTMDSKSTMADIPEELIKDYTVEQTYWDINNQDLINITEEITDREKPVVENAKAIYDYVTKTLHYNTARINEDLQRLGAAKAIAEPDNAVCMEFTDVFVTMARIAGIPAREIDGYAYTTDRGNQPIYYPGLGSDILHAWVQIYLPDDGWVTIDPTWGSTTGGVDFFGRIDLNRIAFVVKGLSSERPYAAGSYKTNNEQDGDVSVDFSQESAIVERGFEATMDRTRLTSGIGGSLPLVLENTGNTTLYDLQLTPQSQNPLRISNYELQALHLLPGQTTTIWLPLDTESWFDNTTAQLSVSASAKDLNGEVVESSQQFSIQIEPFYLAVLMPIIITLVAVIAITALTWYGLHRYHQKQNHPSTL